MFRNLVESGSHATDLRRRGSFFAGTLGLYLVLLSAVGVGSIYAYDANIDTRDDLELLTLMRFPAQPASAEPEKAEVPKRAAAAGEPQAVRRPEAVIMTPYNEHREVGAANVRTINPRLRHIEIGDDNGLDTPVSVGPPGPGLPGNPSGGSDRGAVVKEDVEAPERAQPAPRQEPQQQPKRAETLKLPSSVLIGKAVSKPTPAYPAVAKHIRVQGTVAVQILIDEQGRVVSAQATSGHPLLQKAAVDAARLARFSPTLVGGVPYKVSGVIFYHFVLN